MNILRNNFVQIFGLVSLNQFSIADEMNTIKIKLPVPLLHQTAISVFKAAKAYLHAFLYLVSNQGGSLVSRYDCFNHLNTDYEAGYGQQSAGSKSTKSEHWHSPYRMTVTNCCMPNTKASFGSSCPRSLPHTALTHRTAARRMTADGPPTSGRAVGAALRGAPPSSPSGEIQHDGTESRYRANCAHRGYSEMCKPPF